MDKKILVAYGSTQGSTTEIAEKIGETLRQKGLQVDVLDAGTVNDLTPYSRIILGSSVYIGFLYKKVVRFLKRTSNRWKNYLFRFIHAAQLVQEIAYGGLKW